LDITTLVPIITSTLASYLAKGGEKFAEKLGEKAAEEGFEQRSKIWQLVKDLFAADELTMLDLFAENPEDAKTQGKLEVKLEDRLKDNPEVVGELIDLVNQITELEKNRPMLKNESKIENKKIRNSVVINKVNQS